MHRLAPNLAACSCSALALLGLPHPLFPLRKHSCYMACKVHSGCADKDVPASASPLVCVSCCYPLSIRTPISPPCPATAVLLHAITCTLTARTQTGKEQRVSQPASPPAHIAQLTAHSHDASSFSTLSMMRHQIKHTWPAESPFRPHPAFPTVNFHGDPVSQPPPTPEF